MEEFHLLFSEKGPSIWAFAFLVCLVPLYASAAFFPYDCAQGLPLDFAAEDFPLAACALCAGGALCIAASPLLDAQMRRMVLRNRSVLPGIACAMAALVAASLIADEIAPATVAYVLKAATCILVAFCTTMAAALMRPRPHACCIAAIAAACMATLAAIELVGEGLAAMACATVAAGLLACDGEMRASFVAWDMPAAGSRETFIAIIMYAALAVYAASCVTNETPAFATIVAAAVVAMGVACTTSSSKARYAAAVATIGAGIASYVFGVDGHTGPFLLMGAMVAFAGVTFGPQGSLAGIGAASIGLALPIAFDMGSPYGHIGRQTAQRFFETGDIAYLAVTLVGLALCTAILALQASSPRISLRITQSRPSPLGKPSK